MTIIQYFCSKQIHTFVHTDTDKILGAFTQIVHLLWGGKELPLLLCVFLYGIS